MIKDRLEVDEEARDVADWLDIEEEAKDVLEINDDKMEVVG